MSVRIFCATFEKELRERIRAYPVSFLVGCLFTAFYTDLGAWFMYTFLFKKKLSEEFVISTGSSDYMSYVIVGSIIYLFIVRTCLNVSRTLITELRQGTLQSLMLAPFCRVSYFLGNMCLQVFTTALEAVVATFIGLAFGLQVHMTNPIDIMGAIILSLYAMFAMSLVLGGVMLYTRNTYITQNTLFAIIFLTCGITFPKELLPQGLQFISKLLPVSDVSELIRSVVLRQSHLLEHTGQIIHLLIISSLYLLLGFPMMAKAEQDALEKIDG